MLLLLLVVEQLLAAHLLGLISLLLLLLRVALANRTVQSLRRRGVNERIVQHFGRGRRSGRRGEERKSVTRVTQPSDNGRRPGDGVQTAAGPRLLKRLLVLLRAAGCRRLLRLPHVTDDGSRAAWRYSRTCGVGRIGAISQAAQHFGRRSNHGRRGGARKSRSVVGLLGRRRRTVVVPRVTGVTGHQVSTTVARIVVVAAVVGRGQADDLALDESFTRHGTDGRRRAHDGWNSSRAHNTAADVVVAGRASAAVESAGIIPESLYSHVQQIPRSRRATAKSSRNRFNQMSVSSVAFSSQRYRGG